MTEADKNQRQAMRIEDKPKVRYEVSKLFLDGGLKGMTIKDKSPVPFEVGSVYGGGYCGSRYRVMDCKECDFDNFLAGEPTTGAQQ